MIGLVLVTYSFWPQPLLDSVAGHPEPVLWSIHHHGADPAFAERISALGNRDDVRLHMHRENRGLSRSWNDGLKELYDAGARLVMLVNDDLHFVPGGFARFIDFADRSAPFGLGFTLGLELEGSPLAGQVRSQDFACCIIPKDTIDRVGYFDQNIAPAYCEDTDYNHRCTIAGLTRVTADTVNVEHDRCQTIRTADPTTSAAMHAAMARNGDYYTRKWGPPGGEIFSVAFNDERLGWRIPWEERDRPYPGHLAPDPLP